MEQRQKKLLKLVYKYTSQKRFIEVLSKPIFKKFRINVLENLSNYNSIGLCSDIKSILERTYPKQWFYHLDYSDIQKIFHMDIYEAIKYYDAKEIALTSRNSFWWDLRCSKRDMYLKYLIIKNKIS